MKKNITLSVENLTDEEILMEFVKRFECDGAALIYTDHGYEYAFGRWTNNTGKLWIKELFELLRGTQDNLKHIGNQRTINKDY